MTDNDKIYLKSQGFSDYEIEDIEDDIWNVSEAAISRFLHKLPILRRESNICIESFLNEDVYIKDLLDKTVDEIQPTTSNVYKFMGTAGAISKICDYMVGTSYSMLNMPFMLILSNLIPECDSVYNDALVRLTRRFLQRIISLRVEEQITNLVNARYTTDYFN